MSEPHSEYSRNFDLPFLQRQLEELRAEGRSDPVLQMVSEIMKIQLLSDVNLQRTPELTALAEGDKDLEKLVTMPSEKILLRWINFILKKGGFDRRVSNFSSDLKDSEVYAYLLSVLAPECNVTSSVMPRVGWHRAEAVLKAAHLMGCNEFMTPQDIIDGLPDWNLAFLAHIFHTRNGLSNQGIQLPVVNEFSQEIQNGWEERFFRLWINSLGVSSRINSLFEDLKDGWVLLEVSDKIAPGYVDWSIANRQPIDQQSKMLENCNQVVNIAERLKLPLPKHFGKFIVSETKTMILKLLWGFQRHSIFDQLKNLGFHSDEMEIAQYDILAWANKTVEECSKNSKIESFEDKSLSSGTFFLSLLSAMGPQLVNWSHVTRGENEQEKKLNASYIISIARKLGCSIFLLPEDIVDVNPKMMLCLTASILSTHLLRSSSHLLENENGSSSSHANSNHICRDDTEFILKPVGKNIRKKLIIPREEYVDLLSYQKDAMGWFWKLYCEGTGGILADDMGLGKTRQVAVFIIGLFNSKLVERVLLVAPPTLLSQWETEFFNRGLTANIRRYYGEPNEKYDALHQIIKKGGVLLTTYDLIRSDYSQIRDGSTWDYMVIDEGHLIKNPKTKAFKALVQIPCNRRIVVTGTPIQNCAEELWTLFKFCHPNLLPSFNTFKKDYSSPLFMGNYKDSTNKEIILSSKAAEDLRKLTKPYVLRREKEVLVRSDAIEQAVLGNKTEIVVWLKMTPLQIKLYETQIKLYKLFRSETSELKKKAAINFVVARLLQKISNHPLQISKKDAEEEIEAETESGLIDEIGVVEEMGVMAEMVSRLQHLVQVDDSINASVSSCKLKFIVELLENLLGPHSEHRVLIFSQTRQMLDAIQDVLSTAGYSFLRIDGKTKLKDRDNIAKMFNGASTSDRPTDAVSPSILLLSSRVGGLGLNLTAADRVIIADPAWNPSVDAQSVDRVYRLGQPKHVYIYRLLAAGTIEEKVYEEQVSKTSIFKAMSDDKNFKRYIFKKRRNDFLTLPRKGWNASRVQKRFEKESQNYELGQELSAHLSFLMERGIIGVSIHSMLFRETIPLPANAIESGDIKSFHTSTSFRRKSSSDIIKNAEHLARHPKDWPSLQKASSNHARDIDLEIKATQNMINRMQSELQVCSSVYESEGDSDEKGMRIMADLKDVLRRLLAQKAALDGQHGSQSIGT